MDHSRQAIDNAIKFEVKKDGLQQRQSGDWVLRLTVQAIDMHQTIVRAAMGTRFVCVLVEINDDETPVDHVAQERDKWKSLGAAQQAGIRCKDPVFRAFLEEEYHSDLVHDEGIAASEEERAAIVVREVCGVASRSDLNKPGMLEARIQWHKIDFAFQAWKAVEHA